MLMKSGAASVLGADISPEMVRHANEHNDLVTAAYLFHYARSEEDLGLMAELIWRNLKAGGRFVTYTINPDCDLGRKDPRRAAVCGFEYEVVEAPQYHLIIDDERVDIWQWSREAHETCLRRAGLTDIRWQPLQAPPDAPEVTAAMGFYLANPSCIVLSAAKPG